MGVKVERIIFKINKLYRYLRPHLGIDPSKPRIPIPGRLCKFLTRIIKLVPADHKRHKIGVVRCVSRAIAAVYPSFIFETTLAQNLLYLFFCQMFFITRHHKREPGLFRFHKLRWIVIGDQKYSVRQVLIVFEDLLHLRELPG